MTSISLPYDVPIPLIQVEDVVFNYEAEEVEKSLWRRGLPKTAAKHVGDVTELRAWMAMSVREAVEQYGSGSRSFGLPVERCEDALWGEPEVYLEAGRASHGL